MYDFILQNFKIDIFEEVVVQTINYFHCMDQKVFEHHVGGK